MCKPKVLAALSGIVIGISVIPSAEGAQLYDVNRFLSQSHPFANPAPAAVFRPAPAPMSGAPIVGTKVRSAAPTTQANPAPIPATDTYSSGGMLDGFYATLNLQGGYSNIGNTQANNVTGLTERRVNDWVGGNSASFGYNWKKHGVSIRTELEGFLRYRFDLDYRGTSNGTLYGYMNEVATAGGLINAYYDFNFSWKKMRPYVGAGVGIARHWSQSVRSDLSTALDTKSTQDTRVNSLAWAAMVGFNYQWKKNWLWRMEGRYLDLGEVESGPFGTSDVFTGDYTTTDLLLGAMYLF